MKVRDLMNADTITCSPETNLAAAAGLMWDQDCGVLPVTDGEGKVIGLITDRDICMAVATRHRLASEILVGEVISGQVYACTPQDKIQDALQIMQQAKVRRLPVTNGDGRLQGLISISDIVREAEEARSGQTPRLSYQDAIGTLKEVYRRRSLQQAAIA